MNNRVTAVLLLALSILLSACASKPPAPSTWIGRSTTDIVKQWGDPVETRINDRGNKVLVFTRVGVHYLTKYQDDDRSTYGRPTGSDPILGLEDTGVYGYAARCTTFFEFEDDVAINWHWEGKLCSRIYSGYRAPP